MREKIRYIHRWTSAYQKYAPLWTADQRSWLLDRSSLTKRLISCSQKTFEVRVSFEGVARLFQHEKKVLKCASDSAWIREVELIVDGETWVFARSAVPLSTLTGDDLKLRHLGNKPLGHLLFSSPRYQRNQFEVGQTINHRGDKCWGRRSIFSCMNKQSRPTHKTLLVSETFMPVVFCDHSS